MLVKEIMEDYTTQACNPHRIIKAIDNLGHITFPRYMYEYGLTDSEKEQILENHIIENCIEMPGYIIITPK